MEKVGSWMSCVQESLARSCDFEISGNKFGITAYHKMSTQMEILQVLLAEAKVYKKQ